MSLSHKKTHDIRVCAEDKVSPLYEGLPLRGFEYNKVTFTPSQLKRFMARCIVVGRNSPKVPADSFGFVVTTTSIQTRKLESEF